MERNIFTQTSSLEADIGFARAVRLGSIIAVSGTAPIAQDGSTIGIDNMYEQARACLQISLGAIEALGGSCEHVIRTRLMLTDITRWSEAAKAHGEIFSDIRPACTFVEVKGFIRSDWLIETEMDAVIGAL